MGSWGERLFSDDTACDVRDQWKDAYAETGDAKAATAGVIKSFANDIKGDPDEAASFWLALAVTEHKNGFATPKVLKEARRILSKRLGMGLWEDQGPKAVAARTLEYDRIAALLDSPRPPVKPVKPQRIADSGFSAGDIFRLPLAEGPTRHAYFRVLDVEKGYRELEVTAELLDVPASPAPTPEALAAARPLLLRVPGYHKVPKYRAVCLSGWRSRAFGRSAIERIGASRAPRPKLEYGEVNAAEWKTLAIIARWSIDTSPYMGSNEAAGLARKLPVVNVAQAMHPGKFKRYIDTSTYEDAAKQLMLEDHDYARADKLLDLAQAVDHFGFDYSILRGFALLGLGRTKEAERVWASYLSRFSSKRRSDYEQKFFDQVDEYRRHVQSQAAR